MIDIHDHSFIRRLVEFLPVEIAVGLESPTLSVPGRPAGEWSVVVLRIAPNDRVISLILAASDHDEERARKTRQHVAAGEDVHQARPACALLVRARLARVRYDPKGWLVWSGRQ